MKNELYPYQKEVIERVRRNRGVKVYATLPRASGATEIAASAVFDLHDDYRRIGLFLPNMQVARLVVDRIRAMKEHRTPLTPGSYAIVIPDGNGTWNQARGMPLFNLAIIDAAHLCPRGRDLYPQFAMERDYTVLELRSYDSVGFVSPQRVMSEKKKVFDDTGDERHLDFARYWSGR